VIYFIHGPDRLLARQAALDIANDVDPDGHNTSWLDGRETPLAKLSAAIGAVSFFRTPRVVVVSDFLPRSNKDADSDTEGSEGTSPAAVGFREALASVPESNCLILLEPALSAPPAALKSIGVAINVISGAPPRGRALVDWIQDRALKSGSTISPRSAQYLAASLYPQTWDRKPNNPRYDDPPDMMLLASEVEKLATAAYPGTIEKEHIRTLTPSRPDQRLFRFIDATVGGNLRSALVEWQRLEAAGEEPAQLVAQALGQVELTTLTAVAGTRSAGEVARDLGSIQPSRVSAVMASSKGQHPQAGLSAGDAIAADRKLKSGRSRHPTDALYDLMLAKSKAVSAGHPRSRGPED
jgi:DNA polymerase III delta subunit